MKKFYFSFLALSFLFTISLNAQTDARKWWNSLSPAWKTILQKQELKGKELDPTDEQLDRITKIKFISCAYNDEITSLAPLATLQLLETVQCNDCKNLKSLDGIENLLNLKELDCSNNDYINSLIPVQGITSLEKLNCGNTMVKDLRPLRNLKNLRYLDVHLTTVSELIFLKELANLTHLDVSENYSLFKLDGLESLLGLSEIKLANTQVRSLEPIMNLRDLKSIDFSNCPINSLRPLSSPTLRKSLQEVDCSSTKIDGEQLDYISQHYILSMFRCRDNDLCPADVEDFLASMQKSNPNCIIKIKANTDPTFLQNNCN